MWGIRTHLDEPFWDLVSFDKFSGLNIATHIAFDHGVPPLNRPWRVPSAGEMESHRWFQPTINAAARHGGKFCWRNWMKIQGWDTMKNQCGYMYIYNICLQGPLLFKKKWNTKLDFWYKDIRCGNNPPKQNISCARVFVGKNVSLFGWNPTVLAIGPSWVEPWLSLYLLLKAEFFHLFLFFPVMFQLGDLLKTPVQKTLKKGLDSIITIIHANVCTNTSGIENGNSILNTKYENQTLAAATNKNGHRSLGFDIHPRVARRNSAGIHLFTWLIH